MDFNLAGLTKWVEGAGLPVSVASALAWFMWTMERRQTAREASNTADGNRLSQDETNFRSHLLEELAKLRAHVEKLYSELSDCRKNHEDCAKNMALLRSELDKFKPERN